ncbi:hypothetical protein F511_27861 [Dorcoceras hygrometricum]|uniref:Mucin-2-like n=1 Tax=Dorcoceras hygrometricum TaxID=472368 RepID=A0A2Z7BJF7_9LAMI|nr:hypothetical protein F511_27861 [Dorcoceras hygrometricum]
MALSLTQNALQINFDSVIILSDGGMVSMFKALESSGLRGFLGCSATVYEKYLVIFFENGTVRGNTVVSTVKGVTVNISEDQFAGVFDLPTEGLTSVNDFPANLINEGKSVFSEKGELIKTSCKNKEMKMEFRLLKDILAKAITAKVGSFDAITQESSTQSLLDGVPDLTLGESKALPPLRILTFKSVSKNKSVLTASEEVKEKSMVEKVFTVEAKRRPAHAAEPVAKKKRTTVGRASQTVKDLSIVPVVQEAIPISMEETDSEDTVPLSKVLKTTETSMSDEESMSIDDILKHIPKYVLPPSLSAEDPTKILFNHGLEFREVDWYKDIPKIDPAAKGKASLVEEIKGHLDKEIFSLISANVDFLVQIRDEVMEEIATFFHSFSIHSLSAMKSVSDLVAKEEQLLKWVEIDSLQTAVERRLFITAKYREMLLRKFLEARHQNFVSGTPTSEIDLQVLDMLSEAHRIALLNFLEQLRLHKLKWTRPSSSILVGGSDPVGSTVNKCTDVVPFYTALSTDNVPTGVFDAVQHGQSSERFGDLFVQLCSESSTSTSPTYGSDSYMHFSDDIPQIVMPIVASPPTIFTESTAQLRASIQISAAAKAYDIRRGTEQIRQSDGQREKKGKFIKEKDLEAYIRNSLELISAQSQRRVQPRNRF